MSQQVSGVMSATFPVARPMRAFASRARLLIAATLFSCLNTSWSAGRVHMTEVALTADSVIQFLNRFEEFAEKKNFDLIQDMVHDSAFFRFNDDQSNDA